MSNLWNYVQRCDLKKKSFQYCIEICLKKYCPLIKKSEGFQSSLFQLLSPDIDTWEKKHKVISVIFHFLYTLCLFPFFPSQKTDLSSSSDSLSDGHLGKWNICWNSVPLKVNSQEHRRYAGNWRRAVMSFLSYFVKLSLVSFTLLCHSYDVQNTSSVFRKQ